MSKIEYPTTKGEAASMLEGFEKGRSAGFESFRTKAMERLDRLASEMHTDCIRCDAQKEALSRAAAAIEEIKA
jgi:flagellar biosynthesis/type III secretory pathway protein FliH